VQNIDFWVGEIQHRLVAIDSYCDRRRKMVVGAKAAYDDEIEQQSHESAGRFRVESLTLNNVSDTTTDWESLELEASEWRKQLLASARRFVRKCLATRLLDENKLFQIEDLLGVNLRTGKL